jgi:hypothetical protein
VDKPLYPIYVQNDAIDSLFNQLTEFNRQSRKITKAVGQDARDFKGVNIVASLLQAIGIEVNLSREQGTNSNYSEEEVFQVEPEHTVKLIRKQLSETGVLYDLNFCLAKNRPFGSFVDFQGEGVLRRKQRFIEITGSVGTISFTTICSPEYFVSKSFLMQALLTEKTSQIIGFGIILYADSQHFDIKSLLLALKPQAYHDIV